MSAYVRLTSEGVLTSCQLRQGKLNIRTKNKIKVSQIASDHNRVSDRTELGHKLAECLYVTDFHPEANGHNDKKTLRELNCTVSITDIALVDNHCGLMLSIKADGADNPIRIVCGGRNAAALTMVCKQKHKENWSIFGNCVLVKYESKLLGTNEMQHIYLPVNENSLGTFRTKFAALHVAPELEQLMSGIRPAERPPHQRVPVGSEPAAVGVPIKPSSYVLLTDQGIMKTCEIKSENLTVCLRSHDINHRALLGQELSAQLHISDFYPLSEAKLQKTLRELECSVSITDVRDPSKFGANLNMLSINTKNPSVRALLGDPIEATQRLVDLAKHGGSWIVRGNSILVKHHMVVLAGGEYQHSWHPLNAEVVNRLPQDFSSLSICEGLSKWLCPQMVVPDKQVSQSINSSSHLSVRVQGAMQCDDALNILPGSQAKSKHPPLALWQFDEGDNIRPGSPATSMPPPPPPPSRAKICRQSNGNRELIARANEELPRNHDEVFGGSAVEELAESNMPLLSPPPPPAKSLSLAAVVPKYPPSVVKAPPVPTKSPPPLAPATAVEIKAAPARPAPSPTSSPVLVYGRSKSTPPPRKFDLDALSRVTESVVHDDDDRIAIIPPAVAAQTVSMLQQSCPIEENETIEEKETVYIISFNRNPKEFQECLHDGPELEPLRVFAEHSGYSCRFKGTSVFVHPDQFLEVKGEISPLALKPYHVVVSETYYPLVKTAVERLRSRLNVRERGVSSCSQVARAHGAMPLSHIPAGAMALSPRDRDVMVIHPNLLRAGIPRSMRLRHPESVTQSTTEATGRAHGGLNPRRVCGMSSVSTVST